MFSPEHPLDFHAAIGSVSPAGIVKVLEIGWNIQQFCDSTSP